MNWPIVAISYGIQRMNRRTTPHRNQARTTRTSLRLAGRLHRLHDNKSEVHIYDYADVMVSMLARMYKKRLAGYSALGYTVVEGARS